MKFTLRSMNTASSARILSGAVSYSYYRYYYMYSQNTPSAK